MISVIMPVLNEAKDLRISLELLHLSNNEELIIVDGGSSDDTMAIAAEFTDKVFQTKTGRASVMNHGAEMAAGELLLFLHADCILPENGFRIIRETLNDSGIAAGGFRLSINDPGLRFRVIETAANLRSRIAELLYGDQGIFVKKETFNKVGGYANIPLMEDIEISGKLKRTGRLALTGPPIKVSPRRWLNEGAIHTTFRDWSIAFSYSFLNIPPDKLIKYYRDVR
ncbi:PGL/p-HBAD biosynthesis glycosyltransferase/MT3031 [bacterium BMS3Abin09]|nr:PGL/p-HBAD biosynthesis glycosyltransferase/MT3031 [bacterium BMS3Abin09]GBE41911.1 PGL/p-HBAD biosynthesis glycosyltransferase/MT3031 [bacterium BMS3Bbin09]